MSRIRGTNLPQMGEFNQAALLEGIRVGGGDATRADLARRTGLSGQTVTNAVRRLIEEGLVVENAQRRTGLGRPGTTLAVVPHSRYAVGVHIDPAAVALALLDLTGDVVARRRVPTPASSQPADTLDVVAREVAALLREADVDRDRLLGIGVASPGPIDHARGVVLTPPHLSMWHDVPLRDELGRRTGLPTLLDKDVLAVAAAYLWYAGEERASDAAVVYAGTGVAVGLISAGAVVRGASGNAGEAGHLSTGREMGQCSCGRRDCLGGVFATSSFEAMASEHELDLGLGQVRGESEPARGDRAVDALAALAAGEDDRARRLLVEMGEVMGVALTRVCDLLDLDAVVVSGPLWERLGEWVLPSLEATLAEHRTPGGHGVRTLRPVAGQRDAAVGAACLLLDDLTPKASGLLLA